MWPNGYTACFYNPHVDVRHLKDATFGSRVNDYSYFSGHRDFMVPLHNPKPNF